jgi:hypothetical protein
MTTSDANVPGKHSCDAQGREEGDRVAAVKEQVPQGKFITHMTDVPATYPFALSSADQKPPGGVSPAVKVMVAASDERSNNQERNSFCFSSLGKL